MGEGCSIALPQQYFQSPFQQSTPYHIQPPNAFPLQPPPQQQYPIEQPSPTYTSPAYTPGPHIMQYLSPAPSSATYSPSTTPPQHLPLLAPNSSLAPPSSTSRGRAVVIGINYFNQKGEMKGRTDEARNLARYLEQIKRYRKSDILLLTDDQNGPHGQPAKRNILGALFWLSQHAVQGEKLVLYYSGHGAVATQGRGAKKNKNKKINTKAVGKGRGKGKGKAVEKGAEAVGEEGEGEVGEEDEDEELETIYPVDFRTFKEGMIKPAELQAMLRPARDKGAKLTLILDAHTGER